MYLHSSFARSFYRVIVGFSAERTSTGALPEEMKLTAITCTGWALAKHTQTHNQEWCCFNFYIFRLTAWLGVWYCFYITKCLNWKIFWKQYCELLYSSKVLELMITRLQETQTSGLAFMIESMFFNESIKWIIQWFTTKVTFNHWCYHVRNEERVAGKTKCTDCLSRTHKQSNSKARTIFFLNQK